MTLRPFYRISIIVIAVFLLGKPLFAQELLDKAHYKFQYKFSLLKFK